MFQSPTNAATANSATHSVKVKIGLILVLAGVLIYVVSGNANVSEQCGTVRTSVASADITDTTDNASANKSDSSTASPAASGGESSTSGSPVSTSISQAPNPSGSNTLNLAKAKAEPSLQVKIPKIDLTRILAQNPFVDRQHPSRNETVAKSRPKSTKNKSSQRSTNPTEKTGSPEVKLGVPEMVSLDVKIGAIITGKGKPAALIDNRVVYVNDVVQERWRVVAIRSNGVTFQPISTAN